jgi:hypothetical protein
LHAQILIFLENRSRVFLIFFESLLKKCQKYIHVRLGYIFWKRKSLIHSFAICRKFTRAFTSASDFFAILEIAAVSKNMFLIICMEEEDVYKKHFYDDIGNKIKFQLIEK